MTAAAEKWKKVPGFPMYEVSTAGAVRSLWKEGDPAPMKIRASYNGRPSIDLCTADGRRVYVSVARIVALAFHRKPKPGEVVGYRDFDPANCRADNVYWTTRSKAAEARRKALVAAGAAA